MKFLIILIAKILLFINIKLGRESNLPGSFALKIDKNILSKLSYPNIRIIVTGSYGKASTSNIITSSIRNQGYTVTFNNSGANTNAGALSAILRECNFLGKLKTDVLVLEMDEGSVKYLYSGLNPTHLVVTNITKDRPSLRHNIEFSLEEILTNLPGETIIVTNMDDPFLRNFEIKTPNRVEYYSIGKYEDSYQEQIFNNLNIYRCPRCGQMLKYDYYNFETFGKYNCKLCGLSYRKTLSFGDKLNLNKGNIFVGNNSLNIGGDTLYNAYNTMAAYTVLNLLKIDLDIIDAINNVNIFKKSYFDANGKKYYSLICKLENASTYNHAIFNSCHISGLKDYVIGWNMTKERYNCYDLSWLYDIEFELINDDNLNRVYVYGKDAENIKTRLIIAGIDETKILVGEDLESLKQVVISSRAKIVCGIINFDYAIAYNNAFKEGN